MKTKELLYLIAVIAFTILFYRQDAGINLILFVSLLLTASAITNKNTRNTNRFRLIAAGAIVSSCFVMVYASGLSIIMSIISIVILIFIQKFKNTSCLVDFIGGMSSVFGSLLLIITGRIYSQRLKQLLKSKHNKPVKRWYPILIVGIITFLFLSLYRSISPIFDSYFTQLTGNINWGWIFFTLFGMILLYPFFYPPRFLRKVLLLEQNYGKTITEESIKTDTLSNLGLFSSFENERFSASLLFVILNLLLLLLNGTDIQYLFLKSKLPESITYSDYVHQGVGAVILSIILAIAVIAYYFRGRINFDPKSKYIKTLTYLWIVQNIVLIVMAAFKNQLYIDAYSLTYMRIGVYYFLAFSILGLLLTLYKIYSRKDTWFLFQSNSFGIYLALILSCAFNWNGIVTRYNLENSTEVDYSYLNTLGFQNYPLLWEIKYFDSKQKQEYELQLTGKAEHYFLPGNIGEFLKYHESTGIQSYCVVRKKTYQYFVDQAKSNKLITREDSLKDDIAK